jgi:hypothetical protein
MHGQDRGRGHQNVEPEPPNGISIRPVHRAILRSVAADCNAEVVTLAAAEAVGAWRTKEQALLNYNQRAVITRLPGKRGSR